MADLRPESKSMVLAHAKSEELVLEVQRLQALVGTQTYSTTVRLSRDQGHIYVLSKNDQGNPKAPWHLQGPGFDALNKAAGVTIVTHGEPRIEWDGVMPRQVTIQRVAVGMTEHGIERKAPVTLELMAIHYRMEMITKAATRDGVRVDGFAFGPREFLREENLIGNPHQIFLPQETLGGVEVGYALDTTKPAVRKVLEGGATFAKNLARRAMTVAGRHASKQWHGFDKCATAWVSLVGGDIVADVPIVGWRGGVEAPPAATERTISVPSVTVTDPMDIDDAAEPEDVETVDAKTSASVYPPIAEREYPETEKAEQAIDELRAELKEQLKKTTAEYGGKYAPILESITGQPGAEAYEALMECTDTERLRMTIEALVDYEVAS